jgi:hypothetical protein
MPMPSLTDQLSHIPDVAIPGGTWAATTPWVNFFRTLGGNDDFPSPTADENTLHSFFQSAFIVPGILVILCLLLSAVLLCYLCCHRPKRGSPGMAKPSSKPVVFVTLLTIVLIVVATLGCWATGGKSLDTAHDQLSSMVDDLDTLQKTSDKLNSTGIHIKDQLDLLKTQCTPAVRQGLEAAIANTKAQLQEYLDVVSDVRDIIDPLAANLTDARDQSNGFGAGFAALGLSLPALLVASACAVIFLSVMATRGCGGESLARCNDCCMRLSAIFIVISVLIAGLAASGETATGILSASFCHDPDANTLEYAKHAFRADSEAYQATSYYITGQGTNPLKQQLDEAQSNVTAVGAQFDTFDKTFGTQIQQFCKGWTTATVQQDLGNLTQEIKNMYPIVERDNIYPYYNKIVHEDACTTVIAGLGWLVVVQLLVGMVCLPVLACLSVSFFTKWAAWKESMNAGTEGGGPEVYLIESASVAGNSVTPEQP